MPRRRWDPAVTSLLDRGLVCLAFGNRDDAIELWQSALERSPKNGRARDYLLSVGAISTSQLDAMGASAAPVPSLMDEDADDGPSLQSDPGSRPFTRELPSFSPETTAPTLPQTPKLDVDASDSMVTDVELLIRTARKEQGAGNLKKALNCVEEAMKKEPDRFEAEELAEDIRRALSDLYRRELEPLSAIPHLRATDASILELSLDPIGGFLISQIDGEITVEELLTILGTFDEFRVLSALHFFLENGIIELKRRR